VKKGDFDVRFSVFRPEIGIRIPVIYQLEYDVGTATGRNGDGSEAER